MNQPKSWMAVAAALALVAAPPVARAAPVTLTLNAANTLAETHTRAIMFASTGTFRALHGTLHFDPASGACDVDVTFITAALALPNAVIRARTMSPEFLDPARYPTEHFAGACRHGVLDGALTLRGQTHPFTMTLRFSTEAGHVTAIHAAGSLTRQDWGVDGMPLLVGPTIRVTNDISLDGAPPGP